MFPSVSYHEDVLNANPLNERIGKNLSFRGAASPQSSQRDDSPQCRLTPIPGDVPASASLVPKLDTDRCGGKEEVRRRGEWWATHWSHFCSILLLFLILGMGGGGQPHPNLLPEVTTSWHEPNYPSVLQPTQCSSPPLFPPTHFLCAGFPSCTLPGCRTHSVARDLLCPLLPF